MHPLEKFEYCPKCGSHHFVANGATSKKCENCGFEYFMNPSASNVAIIKNAKGEILVERRKQEPAKGTLDLPGGFTQIGETSEEGLAREVMEETGLKVTDARYLFSLPNIYRYSGIDIHTLDMFYLCEVEDDSVVIPMTFTPNSSVCVQYVGDSSSFLSVRTDLRRLKRRRLKECNIIM